MVAALMIMASATAQEEKKQCENCQAKKFDKTEMVKHRTDRMVQEYGLSQEQADKLLQLNTEYAAKMRPMHGLGGHFGPAPRPEGPQGNFEQKAPEPPQDGQTVDKHPSKEELEAKMKEVKAYHEAYEKSLKKIMTSKQYKKYQENAKQNEERGHRGFPQGPRPE